MSSKHDDDLPIVMPLQGARAVRSGRFGEDTFEAGWKAYGVKVVNYNHVYRNDNGGLWAGRDQLLIRQYPARTNVKIDFMYRDCVRGITLPIEHKQQKGSGTTDEKLAYTVDRLLWCGYKCFWLVLSGGGFNPVVTKSIDQKIRCLRPSVKGRLLFNGASTLQRAIEELVERGEI